MAENSCIATMDDERVISLPKIAFDSGLHDAIFTNISAYPSKIEIDVKYAMENCLEYLNVIAPKTGHTEKELRDMILEFNRDAKPGYFRISIPIVRLKRGCYCAKIYPKLENFTNGILIFNGSFGAFPIELTQKKHIENAKKFYQMFIEMLDRKSWSLEELKFNCPKCNKEIGFNGFCNTCLYCDTKYANQYNTL